MPVHRDEPTNEAIPRNRSDPGRPASSSYGPEQHRAALDRRRSDIAHLAEVVTELAAADAQLDELDQRITQLLTLAVAP